MDCLRRAVWCMKMHCVGEKDLPIPGFKQVSSPTTRSRRYTAYRLYIHTELPLYHVYSWDTVSNLTPQSDLEELPNVKTDKKCSYKVGEPEDWQLSACVYRTLKSTQQ